jgi:hypothetical protein
VVEWSGGFLGLGGDWIGGVEGRVLVELGR